MSSRVPSLISNIFKAQPSSNHFSLISGLFNTTPNYNLFLASATTITINSNPIDGNINRTSMIENPNIENLELLVSHKFLSGTRAFDLAPRMLPLHASFKNPPLTPFFFSFFVAPPPPPPPPPPSARPS